MKFIASFLFVLSSLHLPAQVATFKEIRMPSGRFDDKNGNAVIYPVVVLKNPGIAAIINKTLKKELLDNNAKDSTLSAHAALKQYADRYLVEMSYEIHFNKNGILSLEILAVTHGSYETEWQQHFNFDLNSGKLLTLRDIVKTSKYEAFKNSILKIKQLELNGYYQDLKQELANKDITRDEYERYKQLVQEQGCMDSVSLERFSLTDSVIQVYDACDFPHAIRSEQPYYVLKYNILQGRDLLRKEIVYKLTGR